MNDPSNHFAVLIDGGFYQKINNEVRKDASEYIDIKLLSQSLVHAKKGTLEKILYYRAPPFIQREPTKKQIRSFIKYRHFTKYLAKKGITTREGRLQEIDNKIMEKEVDTLITMDLYHLFYKEKINNLILLTGDSDFIPIIQDLQKEKANMYVSYYQENQTKIGVSKELISICEKTIPLTNKELKKYRKHRKKRKVWPR